MTENKSILHELYVFSEWKPEPEYLQKPDNILPENISALWRWLKFFGPKKSLIDSITAHKERQQKWHIALGDEGKVIAVLTDNILEIRTKRSEYATIAARTTVARDGYPQWRKLVWSPDCSFLALAYGVGTVSFFDLTASNLFNIPTDCSRPGGLECTDNTHAVSEIIFMPLRVKDTKWSWEVVVITFDGALRGYLVSQTEGFSLHHSFQFGGGAAAATYCAVHNTLYVAGAPAPPHKAGVSAAGAGLRAWRAVADEPPYVLSVLSAELDQTRPNDYLPHLFARNMNFIVRMVASPDSSKLVCVHCNGDVSVWRLPQLQAVGYHALPDQPDHALHTPLKPDEPTNDITLYYPADVNWWSNEEVIISRFSGAVSVCNVRDLVNILGKKPEFFQGTPQVTCAHNGAFMALECESNVLPGRKSRSDESMEVVKVEAEVEDSMLEVTKELFKTILYAITDMETFQPKPKKITVVSRIYRLLGVKSTTPNELFSRKIESGNYAEALVLADTFNLDSDLVYQQQWRKNPVSTDAIQNYLSRVSQKIWAVHQCVDRLPESLPAATALLHFGLRLADEQILHEINKELPEEEWKTLDEITLEDLNAYTSELLRCRHVMLFHKERLTLYEAILRCEKSTYVKDEYDRLRSNSIVHSAMEIAREGRIEALTCLWPYIKNLSMQLAVLDKLPETLNPLDYQHLLPTKQPLTWFEKKSPIKIKPSEHQNDWCKKEIFRSIWSSNWSEDTSPESEGPGAAEAEAEADMVAWYERRAREIEGRSGLVSHALTLLTVAAVGGGVPGLERLMFHLLTLDTLLYDINIEGVTLQHLENMSTLDTCKLLMKMSTPETFVSDLKQFVIPFLKRYENLSKHVGVCLSGLMEFLENISIDDLSHILLVLQSPREFELDVRTHLELAERCLMAYNGTDHLHMACDLLATILRETDGSIAGSVLVRRVAALERAVRGSERAARRGVPVPPRQLALLANDPPRARLLLARLARTASRDQKPTQQYWEDLLKDILELQATLFECVTVAECYEIYASALLTSGAAGSIALAADVLTCSPGVPRAAHVVDYANSVDLVSSAAKEYFNSASSLHDPALELAKCCLLLIDEGNAAIKQELDLIAALPILSSFNQTILPIQVRLCEDKMTLIEDCLKLDPNAYLASHKLLKLAKLLRIAGDDEQTREGMVLERVGEYAIAAGGAGGAAAAAAARRLAALRHAPAAELLARLAQHAPAHPHHDRAARAHALAAALALAPPHRLRDVLRARLKLELEGFQQMGAAMKEHNHLQSSWPSTDDEFSDAITTPVIEKKDLVAPAQTDDKKVPLFNYLLDTFQNKFGPSKEVPSDEVSEQAYTVHCHEFYRSVYGAVAGAPAGAYCRFAGAAEPAPARALLAWLHVRNCLDDGGVAQLEPEVVQKFAEEVVYSDTALSVACLLRSGRECALSQRLVDGQRHRAAVAAVLYAALVNCNAPDLRDNVYLTKPCDMARMTLKKNNASEEQMAIIRQCLNKLSSMGEVEQIKGLGVHVNGLLFNADPEYRQEIVYRLARTSKKENVELACSLAKKYSLDVLDVWLQYAIESLSELNLDSLPDLTPYPDAFKRIRDVLWSEVHGTDYAALAQVMAVLKAVDDKQPIFGLTAAEHIKLLKKAKAASPELDYKLLVEGGAGLAAHVVRSMRPENVGLLSKLLRTLPPPLKLPVPVSALYTDWLINYFFSENGSGVGVSSKKWMQQYRQCASYFHKLPKEELLRFLNEACFSPRALERVPWNTRNLMLLQAVDYCQQEQENEIKFNKNEQSWAAVAQELSRRARFLENFHSDTVQAIIDNSDIPRDQIWPSVEGSAGGAGLAAAAGALAARGLRAPPLRSLLRCLHADLEPALLAQHLAHHAPDVETYISRLIQYHKEGVQFPEEVICAGVERALAAGVAPHRQVALLALARRGAAPAHTDLLQLAASTAQLFKAEWPASEYVAELTGSRLCEPSERALAFETLSGSCGTAARRHALAHAVRVWPHTVLDGRSLHSKYLDFLLKSDAEDKECLVLIKLLLEQPVLSEEEVQWLAESATESTVMNTIWIVLLSRCERYEQMLHDLVTRHKDTIQKQEIDEDLIKEILDQGIFIKFVSTPLYPAIISYVLNTELSAEEPEAKVYTVQWATGELVKANCLAEAGHLQLTALGVPPPLRGFTQSVLYITNIFK